MPSRHNVSWQEREHNVKGARMIDHHHADQRPFLTVVKWPDGWSREDVAHLIAESSGLDEPTLRLRLGKAPPTIVAQGEPAAVSNAVLALIGAGGDAFAATLDDLAALGPTLKIKDLRLENGLFTAQLWRGPSAVIRPADIQVVVRVRLSEKIITREGLTATDLLLASTTNPRTAGVVFGWGLGGAYGMSLGVYSAWQAGAFAPERDLQLSHKLDLHTVDGRVFQIDGDKFGYRILGELRGDSDNVNIDRMCELMSHLAPDAVIDPYFSLWSAPPGYQRLRLKNMRINNDDPAFAFYSRWAALLYRHVLGQSTDAN